MGLKKISISQAAFGSYLMIWNHFVMRRGNWRRR